MVVWYIGAPGTGNGNPYGIAAATVSLRLRLTYRNADLTDFQMVFVAPFLFIRIVAPPQWSAFAIMVPVTLMVSEDLRSYSSSKDYLR
jgi:hypothetical protein